MASSVDSKSRTEMKVLHVIPSLSDAHGGPTRALAAMERALSALDVDVRTVTSDDDGPHRRKNVALGVELQENGVGRIYFSKAVEFYKIAPGIFRWMVRHVSEFDVVHIHALFSFSSVAAAWAAQLFRVPYIVRPLGTLNNYGLEQRRPGLKKISMALFEKPILRRASAVQFTSREEQLEAGRFGIPMREWIVPLGIDSIEWMDRNSIETRFPIMKDREFILFLSRLDPKKNVEGLLDAFRDISSRTPRLMLLIAGDGKKEYVDQLKDRMQKFESDTIDRIVWAGNIEGEEKRSALCNAIMFVLPSYSENFGIAAAEALMAGRPVILSRGVAISSDVESTAAGIVVGTKAEEIADAMQRLINDADLRKTMSGRARELAKNRFSSAAMGTKLVEMYEEVLSRKND